MRRGYRYCLINSLYLTAVILASVVILCGCSLGKGKVSETDSTEDTESFQPFYETPDIPLIRMEDNTRRKRAVTHDGPDYIYYLFDKNGEVYRLDDPDLSLEELTAKYSDGSLSDKVWLLNIENKKGLQKCFDKLQLVFLNKDFKLTEPDIGPAWTHKDITWYGLYYDEDHKLQTKIIYFVGNLESDYITNDRNADDIVKWFVRYVPVTSD